MTSPPEPGSRAYYARIVRELEEAVRTACVQPGADGKLNEHLADIARRIREDVGLGD